ncbi:aspartate/tyrosine/aromatic aminotransferase [Parasalinivibrio latis]|uniref:amino acid aminotransferase n=1 Tax=Parasalinivibrio latis TaxID=2952610 RepID=UPI0030DFD02D
MFEKITAAPADPILGLTEEFKADTRADKINLGVGIYKDEAGNTPVLATVKKAEKRLLDTETTKSYLAIAGTPEYGIAVQELLFGKGADIITDKRAQTAQAPGGTGALRLAAEFIKRQLGDVTVWISNPTWANHQGVFKAAGLDFKLYSYYDAESKNMDFDAMLTDLEQAAPGDVVLLHGCCHNPTGIDPDAAQWETLAKLCAEKNLLPMFDFAYQGFAKGVEEDAAGLRTFAKYNKELLVASSFSKNFGLYNERVGAFTLVAPDSQVAATAFSQVKSIARVIYSNPPAHGSAVVTEILNDAALRNEWEAEVAEMRDRIQQMRELFVVTLKEKGVEGDFSFIERQNGMFSFSGLNKDQVQQLKDEFGVYIVGSGRISVAGMTRSNMEPLCDAIAAILK